MTKCQSLDDDLKPCPKKAYYLMEYFGDPEIYGSYNKEKNEVMNCVMISVCKKHGDANYALVGKTATLI